MAVSLFGPDRHNWRSLRDVPLSIDTHAVATLRKAYVCFVVRDSSTAHSMENKQSMTMSNIVPIFLSQLIHVTNEWIILD